AYRALKAAVPSLPAERLRDALAGRRRLYVGGGLTPRERAALHALALGGVYFEEEEARVYPLGSTAGHLVGFTDTGGDGVAGIERAFNEDIQTAGARGETFPLAIDLRIQGALENELRANAIDQQARGAVGIVTNVRTGEILAVASWPDFDPNQGGRASPEAQLNRASSSLYEMGSTFKIFTTAAGLDTGVADMNTTFDASSALHIGGRAINDFHAANKVMTLEEVFLHSSNIGTSRLALQMGRDAIVRYFGAFGLLNAAPVEGAATARPVTPRNWNADTIASASFGHAIMVTPMNIAAAVGAVANGGTFVPLTFRRLSPGRQPQGRRILRESTSVAMLDLMRRNAVRGSGTRANVPGLRVGGKTGSANKVVGGRYSNTSVVSSFAAVFPTDGPVTRDRYLVLILVDEPRGSAASFGLRTAGFTAAPAAGRVIERIAPFLGVARAADPYATALGERPPLAEETSGGVR
ncbi:MAG TPA: penicillin-binding protein 2, partial [Caulobacteraceae bacterium]